jgi:hypothetical protein
MAAFMLTLVDSCLYWIPVVQYMPISSAVGNMDAPLAAAQKCHHVRNLQVL